MVQAAFVLAIFGWGIGFYGPPVYLHAVMARTGWPLQLVSLAITAHFLTGALVVANLPRLYASVGIAWVTALGAFVATLGLVGWALAEQRWQLFAAATCTGAGWVTVGAAAVNAVIAPWYARRRPVALANPYNGASIGGVLFAPLWAFLIARFGFLQAVLSVGAVTVALVAPLAFAVLSKTPANLGQQSDGEAPGSAPSASRTAPVADRLLWRNRRFLTLAFGMSIGMFATIGLLAHLYVLLMPVAGAQHAGWLMAAVTGAALMGRMGVARWMPVNADRRRVICACYAVQLVGTVALLAADAFAFTPLWLLAVAALLFGFGIGNGNGTSLPPLLAQVEFDGADVQRVVSLAIPCSQATYAFAPALLGVVLAAAGGSDVQLGSGAGAFLIAIALVQAMAIAVFLAGRKKH
ncbi:MAG: MFS transporter [Burkholderiaceae bacterium]